MNQVFVIHSFTILDIFAHLCFMWVVLDSQDSCKWFIASLNGLCTGRSDFRFWDM